MRKEGWFWVHDSDEWTICYFNGMYWEWPDGFQVNDTFWKEIDENRITRDNKQSPNY